MKRLLRPLGALFGCLITTTVYAQDFYEAHFLGGVTDFNRGAYARAADELRIAAFGRIDDVARYEVAEIYLSLASDKLDKVDDARVTALKVIQADRVRPVYASLDLPRDIRAAFEALLPTILTREQLVHAPAFEHLAGQAPQVQSDAPRLTKRPNAQVPTPTKRPNVAVTVEKNDDKVETRAQNLDYGRMALERVAAGDEAGGQHYADLALAQDDTNVNAHTALAQIALIHGNWNGVAEHYAVVRTRRKLTDDESAAYFIALVKTSRTADALGVRKGLAPSVLARNDVQQALQSIQPNPVPQPQVRQQPAPQPPAPQPQVRQQPVPQPPAPQPQVRQQPVSQPPAPQPQVRQQPVPQPPPAPQPQVRQQPVPQPPAPQPQVRQQPAPPASQPEVREQPVPEPVAAQPAPRQPAPQPAAPGLDAMAQPLAAQIAAAERMIGKSNIVGARTELRRIAALPDLQRSERLALGRAMSQTGLYAESSAQYRKAYPLKAGEEAHMFYESVNRYQLGDFELARQLMTRAFPSLPQTPAILAYRDRILAQQ